MGGEGLGPQGGGPQARHPKQASSPLLLSVSPKPALQTGLLPLSAHCPFPVFQTWTGGSRDSGIARPVSRPSRLPRGLEDRAGQPGLGMGSAVGAAGLAVGMTELARSHHLSWATWSPLPPSWAKNSPGFRKHLNMGQYWVVMRWPGVVSQPPGGHSPPRPGGGRPRLQAGHPPVRCPREVPEAELGLGPGCPGVTVRGPSSGPRLGPGWPATPLETECWVAPCSSTPQASLMSQTGRAGPGLPLAPLKPGPAPCHPPPPHSRTREARSSPGLQAALIPCWAWHRGTGRLGPGRRSPPARLQAHPVPMAAGRSRAPYQGGHPPPHLQLMGRWGAWP